MHVISTITDATIGMTIEHRLRKGYTKISYCFLTSVYDIMGQPRFDKDEQAEGYTLLWLPFPEALERLQKDAPDDYTGKFVRERELAIMHYAQRVQ